MKKIIVATALTILLAGCAMGPYPSGMLYTGQTVPLDARDNSTDCAKRGEASTTNYLGYIAVGDAGVGAAKENGGITTVGSVDVKVVSILGLITTSTTVVCGS